MQDEFADLVKRIEADADRNLTLYKVKLLLLAVLGYVYIFLVLAVLLVLIGLLFWAILSGKGLNSIVVNIEIGLLVLVSIVTRSLWTKVPAPKGIELSKEQAPALVGSVEETRRAVDGPVVHKILITDEFNAAVVPVPRMGLFGWSHNHLLLGLPLMHALSPAEFRAVLAHEMGHLAGAHGRFSSWIYRIRLTWQQLMVSLAVRRHWGSRLFAHFFRWYVPYFGVYSFVLARRHEYEADLCASEVATAQTAAAALIKCEVYGRFLNEKFCNDFSELVKTQSSPPGYYSKMAASLKAGLQNEDASHWLRSALEEETVSWNTHPSLKDRLSALGQMPQVPAPPTQSAAETYFSDQLNELIERLNVEWQEENAVAWKEQHERFQAVKQELGELNLRAASNNLTAEEAHRRAYLIHATEGSEAAIPFYRETLSLDKDHPLANYALGRIMLLDENHEGIEYLERAMDQDEQCVPGSCELLYNYFTRKGDVVAAQRYSRRATALARVYANANAERSQASFVDRFVSHDLPDQDVEHLRRALAGNVRIREAYLVRKELKYKPEQPLYALGLVFDQPRLKRSVDDSEFAKQLPDTLKTQWQLYSFVLDAHNKRLATTLRNVPNSLIYQR